MAKTAQPHTFEGFLGSDPELRFTKESTKVVLVKTDFRTNGKLDKDQLEDAIEVTTPARDYLCLSVAVQERSKGKWETRWLQLRIWDPYATRDWSHAWTAAKGDRVCVTGYLKTHAYTDAEGCARVFEYLELTSFRSIERKSWRELERSRNASRGALLTVSSA